MYHLFNPRISFSNIITQLRVSSLGHHYVYMIITDYRDL